MSNAVICAYARSPFTVANKGELATVRPDDILAQTVRGLLDRCKVNESDIEALHVGCAFPEGEQGLNIARQIVFMAKLPITVAASTVNQFCGSSMQAIHMAATAIASGAGELFVCAGIESMSRIPMGGFNPAPHPELYETYPDAYISMGMTAENVADQYKIDRKAQEQFALASHQKAAKANFADEIVSISADGNTISKDGCIRPDTTLEAMATLSPAFKADGSVTAATSSPLTDGAAAVIVASEAYADKHGLPKLARIKSTAIVGVAPEIMGIGPVAAAKKALARAGIDASKLDVVELNEAFAAQSIACIKDIGINADKVNLEGGSIAIGHPLGASGVRITGKAALLLKKTGGSYALATQCIGGGQGIATVLEKI